MAKKQHGGKREGSGRAPLDPEGATMTVAVTVPGSLVERLDAVAKAQDWNRSKAVREAIQLLLKRHEPK